VLRHREEHQLYILSQGELGRVYGRGGVLPILVERESTLSGKALL
jgi:hypothetical protein